MLAEVNSSLGYETVKETFHPQNSGYESLPEPDSLTPGYERIREPNGGYEKIRYATTKEDESDPNYEELKPQTTENEPFHCYATINKKSTNSNNVTSPVEERLGEPDYASLTRRANHVEYDGLAAENDPFYERIRIRRSLSGQDALNDETEDDMNNNHASATACSNSSSSSSLSSKENESSKDHSAPKTNVNDLYSKVNKSVKR